MDFPTYADTNLPTAEEIRLRWCAGLSLVKKPTATPPIGAPRGFISPRVPPVPLTDDDIQQFINGAVSSMERHLGIFLKPTYVASNPWDRGMVEGIDYEVGEPAYEYNARKYQNYGFMQLRHRPIEAELKAFKLILPNNLQIIDFLARPEWIKVYPKQGQVQIVPYAGDPTMFAMMGSTLSGFQFVTGALNANMPQMVVVDYIAGYPIGKVPDDIRNMVAKMASKELLQASSISLFGIYGNVSTSMDGLSESTGMGNYGNLISQYEKDMETFFNPSGASVRSSARGFTFTIL